MLVSAIDLCTSLFSYTFWEALQELLKFWEAYRNAQLENANWEEPASLLKSFWEEYENHLRTSNPYRNVMRIVASGSGSKDQAGLQEQSQVHLSFRECVFHVHTEPCIKRLVALTRAHDVLLLCRVLLAVWQHGTVSSALIDSESIHCCQECLHFCCRDWLELPSWMPFFSRDTLLCVSVMLCTFASTSHLPLGF